MSWRICAVLLLASAAPASDIEPRLPLSAEQNLRVAEDSRTVTVTGETFAYTFSKANGLITAVHVLGQQLSAGIPIPNLVLAEQLDRQWSPYSAARETQARVTVKSAGPARVLIQAEGAYVSEAGERFPLSYSIAYDITTDGVVMVDVRNTATAQRWFRWLTLSGGAVRSSLVRFVSWMPEQAAAQSSGYQFRPVGDGDEKILAGTFLPWFWLGNATVGLEVSTWDVSSQTYNLVDGSTRRDQREMFAARRTGERIEWENYLVRNTATLTRPGWTRSGRFALAVTPAKKFDPQYALLKGAILGPYQHRPDWRAPTEEQIMTLARNGIDLVVGIANWRSGDYIPLNEEELRRTIALCHKHGIKVIPYLTLMDLSHASPEFQQHGEEWAIEPTTENFRMTQRFLKGIEVENAYRMDPEQETTLMCPGSAGWRAYWKRQVARVIDNYDFDGLYFDFWYGKMVCENARHGCGGRYRAYTVPGAREMLMFAYNRMKTKDPHAVIKANTNLLATALLTSLIDVRLVGEGRDVTAMDAASRQWLYSSYRLGEPTEFLWARTRWDARQRASFAALVNFLPQYYERPSFEPRNGFDDFDVFRAFDAGRGRWHLGLDAEAPLKASAPEVSVNVVERGQELLATVINTSASEVAAQVPIEGDRVVYEPLSGRRWSAEGALQLKLAASEYRTFLVLPQPAHPRVIAALGARAAPVEAWDARARLLRIEPDAPARARMRILVYSEAPAASVSDSRGGTMSLDWSPEAKLVSFEAIHEPGQSYRVQF